MKELDLLDENVQLLLQEQVLLRSYTEGFVDMLQAIIKRNNITAQTKLVEGAIEIYRKEFPNG